MKRTLPLLIMLFISSCYTSDLNEFQIAPLPIAAMRDGVVLSGASVLGIPDMFVWGASVLKGDDGKYHMVFATWESGDTIPPFTDSWVLHSKLGYAVSDFPDRGFEYKKIILRGRRFDGDSIAWDSQMVTNPHLKTFNGKYYLYFVGANDPKVQQGKCLVRGAVNKRNRVQQSQQIGVIEFDSFADLEAGIFKRPNSPILSPRTRVKPDNIVNPSPIGTRVQPDNIIVTNPSVVQRRADGKYLLYFKGNIYDPYWKGVHGVAVSDSPVGPFVATDDVAFEVLMEDGKIASAEDPYVWYRHLDDRYYAVIKDFTGKITGSEPGLAILESADGVTWAKSTNPHFMKKELSLQSGELVRVNRLERPQLLIDEDGNPLVLYAACSLVDINPRQDGVSFNVQIPLRVE
ncbi:MAG: glycoside hydrolase family protein [Bacteroidales bacterium]